MGEKISIYTLIDPNTNDIRYVGKSKDIQKRFAQHCRVTPHSYNEKLSKWIYGLIANGQKPILDIIDSCDDSGDGGCKLESSHIRRLISVGYNLFNRAYQYDINKTTTVAMEIKNNILIDIELICDSMDLSRNELIQKILVQYIENFKNPITIDSEILYLSAIDNYNNIQST